MRFFFILLLLIVSSVFAIDQSATGQFVVDDFPTTLKDVRLEVGDGTVTEVLGPTDVTIIAEIEDDNGILNFNDDVSFVIGKVINGTEIEFSGIALPMEPVKQEDGLIIYSYTYPMKASDDALTGDNHYVVHVTLFDGGYEQVKNVSFTYTIDGVGTGNRLTGDVAATRVDPLSFFRKIFRFFGGLFS